MESKFVFWAITSFIGLLFIIMGVLIRTIWNMVFSDLRKRKTDLEKEGGVVTRDKFFLWCEEKQSKCSSSMNCKIEDIVEWRNAMFEKGGPVLSKDHDEICDKVTTKAAATFARMVDERFAHHRELVTAQLGEFGANLQRKLIEIVTRLGKDLPNNGSEK